MTLTAEPSGTPDWFVVPWEGVYERLRLAPQDVPGTRQLPRGASERRPWPMEVHRTHLELLGAPIPPPQHHAAPHILRPHQVQAVDYIRARRGTLLADAMRVGKSASTMYAFEPEQGPMLVVGPVASRAVWHEWAARRFGICSTVFGGNACSICLRVEADSDNARPSFLSLDGRTYRPELLDQCPYVLFCTHAVVATWRELATSLLARATISKLGMLAIDEVHTAGCGNRKSLTYESLKWLNSLTDRVVLLSGTPMPNKPSGLWALLDLAAPAAFGDFWTCSRRYFDAKPTEYGWKADGLSHEDELKLRLKEIMLRRTWRDIAPNLPPITRSIETVQVTDKQRDEIEETAAKLRYQGGNAKTLIGIMARLRRLFANVKLNAGIKATQDLLANGCPVVVWVYHQDVAEAFTQKFRADGVRVYGPITGKITGSAREAILEDVRNAKGRRVLVASIATLGTAVSLTWAEHEVFVELDWNPHVIQQSEARIFSPERPCSALYLVADCPTDENLINALLQKFESQGALNLRAGEGDLADVLQRSLGVEGQTLNDLAERLVQNAEGEI